MNLHFQPNALWSQFSETAESWASEDAVIVANDRITFFELWSRVAARGYQLVGLNPELRSRFVPVLVDFSLASVVDVLACLCFRIPFAPLDPTPPSQRVEHLWELLGKPSVYLAPPGFSGDGFLQNLLPLNPPDGREIPAPPSEVLADEDAIAVMTSGSTGSPKGVVFSFSVLDLRNQQAIDSFAKQLGRGRVTSFAPLHFIGGMRQLAQIFAGRGLIRLEPGAFPPRELLKRVAKEEPTHLSIPAQLLRILGVVAKQQSLTFRHVIQVTAGAEAIRYEWLKDWETVLNPAVQVWHSLGSTEAASSFIHHFLLRDAHNFGKIPVGKPETNGTLRLIPWGEELPNVFEVWRSGEIVSKYLGDPAHNEHRFEFDADGTKWWKSGDLVEKGDGDVYYHHSRVDDLVKIRGKLASPSETEGALMSVDIVSRAAVFPEDFGGRTILVAHVELEREQPQDSARIRTALKNLLPEHLVPSKIYFHTNLPTNARGKIDRAALKNWTPTLT